MKWVIGDILATMDVVLRISGVGGDDWYVCRVGCFVDDQVVYKKGIEVRLTGGQLIAFLGGDYPVGLVDLLDPKQLELFDGEH